MSTNAYPARRYRARVAPRGRRRGSRIRWDRLGRIVLVLVLFAVLVSYVNPVVNLVDSWRDSKAERERLDEARDRNQALRTRLERLDGDRGAKDAASAGAASSTAAPPDASVDPAATATPETPSATTDPSAGGVATEEPATTAPPAEVQTGTGTETAGGGEQSAGGVSPG